ncbi:MAG: hypothetical protein JJ971_11255 [Balneolaceae bacterium]|nr:hypothetical protein [Balneolaceae bacterium]MBO6546174.1 hypothetical protein [Balneolaceae bacterium]MBO6648532.1 hypothetical protein [Balneolaceae bacterium]
MKKQNRTIIYICTLFFALTSSVFAQESDHQIKTDFETKYTSLEESLNTASSVNEVDSLKAEIDSLIIQFESHRKLLDVALYPQSFEHEINAIIQEVNSAEQRLLIIENQSERLAELSREVAVYKSEISFLNSRADSLRKAIALSMESEERLATLVKRYRQNLERRDEIIMDVVDSLMVTYSGMSMAKVEEIAGNVESGRISTSDNPLEMIENIIEENTEYAASANRALSVEDHLRMYAVQNHFEDTWSKIGHRLITAYAGDKRSEWNTRINEKMRDWRMTTSQKMWNSMDQYLEFSEVNLGAFDNNYSFFVALDNFVREAKKKSEDEIISSESYQDYLRFQDFWSDKIKNEWSNLIQDADVLTVAQISSIDDQLSGWEYESRPIHPFLIVLLVLSAVSLIGFSLAMFKTKKA